MYNVNPALGCLLRHGPENRNSVNDCCYNTCAAFTSNPTQEGVIASACGQMCKEQSEILTELNLGHGPCAHKPIAPIVRDRPLYFSSQLQSGKTPDAAYKACVEMCGNDNVCNDNCLTDRMAVMKGGNNNINKEGYEDDCRSDGGGGCGMAKGFVYFIVLCLVIYFILYMCSRAGRSGSRRRYR